MSTKIGGVVVEFPQYAGEEMTAAGTRFFLEDGTEVKGVTTFSMPEHDVNGIISITLTLPLLDVRYVPKRSISQEEVNRLIEKVRNKLQNPIDKD